MQGKVEKDELIEANWNIRWAQGALNPVNGPVLPSQQYKSCC
jgi:hypothetical protein